MYAEGSATRERIRDAAGTMSSQDGRRDARLARSERWHFPTALAEKVKGGSGDVPRTTAATLRKTPRRLVPQVRWPDERHGNSLGVADLGSARRQCGGLVVATVLAAAKGAAVSNEVGGRARCGVSDGRRTRYRDWSRESLRRGWQRERGSFAEGADPCGRHLGGDELHRVRDGGWAPEHHRADGHDAKAQRRPRVIAQPAGGPFRTWTDLPPTRGAESCGRARPAGALPRGASARSAVGQLRFGCGRRCGLCCGYRRGRAGSFGLGVRASFVERELFLGR